MKQKYLFVVNYTYCFEKLYLLFVSNYAHWLHQLMPISCIIDNVRRTKYILVTFAQAYGKMGFRPNLG